MSYVCFYSVKMPFWVVACASVFVWVCFFILFFYFPFCSLFLPRLCLTWASCSPFAVLLHQHVLHTTFSEALLHQLKLKKPWTWKWLSAITHNSICLSINKVYLGYKHKKDLLTRVAVQIWFLHIYLSPIYSLSIFGTVLWVIKA